MQGDDVDVTQQQEDPYAEITIDQLLSMYAIAYKEERFEQMTEYRDEILNRVRALKTVQYILSNIPL